MAGDYYTLAIITNLKSTYEDNVRLIKEKIADGDIYQVNLCRILSTDCDQSLQGLAVNLQSNNPAPFASYLKLDGLEIASASPEFIFREKRFGD